MAGPRLWWKISPMAPLTTSGPALSTTAGHLLTEGLLSSRWRKGFWPDLKSGYDCPAEGILLFLGYLRSPAQPVTRYVPVVCQGLSGTSGWTTCACKSQAQCTCFSLPPQVKKFLNGALLGKTALHSNSFEGSFNSAPKSYTNSVLFILSWLPWETGLSEHWHFCPHVFKHAGWFQLNLTKRQVSPTYQKPTSSVTDADRQTREAQTSIPAQEK